MSRYLQELNERREAEREARRNSPEGIRARQESEMRAVLDDYNAGRLSDDESETMTNILATRGAVQSIAHGLQGVVDVANAEGGTMADALPHFANIESAAAVAQYSIESGLPIGQRRRHAFDVLWVAFMLACAVLIAWAWK